MSGSDPVVVDTDAYGLLFVRRGSTDPRIGRWRELLTGRRVLIAFQTRAELLAGGVIAGWGERRMADLREILDRTPTIGVDTEILDSFVAITAGCRRSGHALHAKEHTADRWIAACALGKGVELLAGDRIYERAPLLSLLA